MKVNGITLIALVVTIIILLILAGVAVNTLIGKNGIINSTISTVEKNNIVTWKEKIELSIIELISLGEKEITIDKIIDKLIEKGITTEENSNRYTSQVRTEDGYIYEIKKKENGSWEVIYIGKGELAKTELAITVAKDISALTTKVTLTIKAKADSGIKSYTSADGTRKTYSNGEKEISETYEITANGTYTFTVENNKGKSETKEIVIGNILEGTIGMSPSKEEATNENVIVTVVWPEGSEQGTKEIQIGEGEWIEYTGEQSEITIEENCIVRARVKSSAGDVTSSSITITNIDKTAPTSPTITGGSTEYATSRTITVSTAATDEGSGILYYEYYLSSESTTPTISTTATGKVGNTASENSKTFNTDYDGYYVYFRAKDNAGNIGEWSEAQRLYIDTNEPTVTANQSSVTITEGDSNAVSGYFTVSANGNSSITSTTYSLENTNTLAAGTHTITCTVTKANGLSTTASMTVIVNVKKPDYTEQSWTTAGTYTWTCPEGVTRVRVAVCGGGGGGVMGTDFVSVEEGGSGGTSKFGELIEATGAIGLKVTVIYSGGRVSQWKHEGYTPGSPNGNKGASTSSRNYVGGGKGFALSFEKANGEYGQGGRARGYYSSDGPQDYSWSGHSGGYNTNYFDVIPGNSYEIIVGEGGEPCELGKTSGYAESGTSGFVFIAYGGDI